MEIKLTSNSIQAFSSAGEYILAPEINWERHFYNCHEFFIDDSGNKISKALVELATYPDVTWHHIYQVLTIIKLLHPKHEIACQATFDRLTVPKRLTLDNMKAELELYEILGDPKSRFNPDRTDVYTDDQDNPIGNLVEDLDGVPVIKNLRETINIDRATFECKDPLFKNIIIKAHQGTI